ncbi:glycoside hydrolase family 97 catalytic domain-containing protein [Mucilaginibacter sp. PAMB04274]|uniref:glycoside hydrolase family 97 protein n=1 Tax=Mucilaginibacter sp. PAMB04274 TaxID=3138568 RepID=UPI0031F65076
MKNRFLLLAGLLLFMCFSAQAQVRKVSSLRSPNGTTLIELGIRDQQDLVYRISFNHKPAVLWSLLGLRLHNYKTDKVVNAQPGKTTSVRSSFRWPLGETSYVDNSYNALTLQCKTTGTPYQLSVRVYNGSIAIRYRVDLKSGSTRLEEELTEYNLASASTVYQYHEESLFRPLKLDSLTGICDQPATLVQKSGLYLSIGEADNRNYTKCVFVHGKDKNSLKLQFYTDTVGRDKQVTIDTAVTFDKSLLSPWRTISMSTNAVGLHNFSQLNLKLVEPSNTNLENIRPGKVFRVPISTEGALEGVDFAAKMNFQYIMLDAGWYGAEFRTTSDPTQPIPTVNIPKITNYARSKDIGVILYVNYVGLKAKLDTILPLFKKWGVSGMKFGFIDGGTQQGLAWLDQAVKKVNDYGFVLNVHDHYKPTGTSRRYPYHLSQEGIRGDENSPDAFHNMVLPFTRFLAGPADFTFCFPNAKSDFAKNLKVSKGQQLALTVVYFDPLQAIFWYGKAGDYQDEKEIEFFKYVPTVWDDSKYLDGKIGEYISVARRKGETWYMGNAAGLIAWRSSIPLSFLTPRKEYIATIYEDDEKKGILKREVTVTSQSQLDINLKAKGGQALIIRPKIRETR